MDEATASAREYLRVSVDRSGRERSNTEQAEDNRRVWSGWTWGEPYSDAASASRYARGGRDDWDVLIADLAADRFDARHLVLWESSRGSRKVGEWVELLDLLEARDVLVAVTEHHRAYDPSVPRDRRSLLEDAVDSEYESAKTSRRVRRGTRLAAVAGKPHGRIPFGYRRVYDERTGALAAQEIVEAEAAVVRDLYRRLKAGHSLRGIANDLAARGVEKRSGGPFALQQLRNMAINPLYMGKRVSVPGRRNRTVTGRELHSPDAIVADAVWPAIVDERTWRAVNAILTDPSRRTHRPGRGRHLLSGGIVRCDGCSGPLSARYISGERWYQCSAKSCVRVAADVLDGLAEAAMIAYLSRPDNIERLLADDGNDEAIEAARLDVAKIKADLDDLADRLGRREISPALAARAEPQMLADLKAANTRVAELSTPSKLRGLIEPGEDVARRWKATPMAAKREIARMLLAPDVLGELRVTRSPTPRHRVPIEMRVVWRKTPRD